MAVSVASRHDLTPLDRLLDEGVASGAAPCVVAMVASADKLLYSRAVGSMGEPAGLPVSTNSIFWLASLSKAITSAAAMQLIEAGRLRLDMPIAELVSAFSGVQVLAGFDQDGRPSLRAPRRQVELRHLLTHMSGLGYDMMSPALTKARSVLGPAEKSTTAMMRGPLLFEPGESWSYGPSTDWVGLAVAEVSGCPLGEYLDDHIFGPLAMRDTAFTLDRSRLRALVPLTARGADGGFIPIASPASEASEFQSGGAGLAGSSDDYIRFLQMLLGGGVLDGVRILDEESCQALMCNQTGDIRAGATQTADPVVREFDLFPDVATGWSFAGMTNSQDIEGGRRAGSMGWAGMANMFYWVDPKVNLCAVLMSQYFPFADPSIVALLRRYETIVYEIFGK